MNSTTENTQTVADEVVDNSAVATAETTTTDETTTTATDTAATDVAEDLIELPNGDKVTAKELVNGFMRHSDYTKKTQEVAAERKRLEAAFAGIGNVTDGKKTVDASHDTAPKKPKYDPKQLDELKGILAEFGVVTKEDLTKQTVEEKKNAIVNSFFAQHPEYSPEQDPGDVKLNMLKGELSLYNLDNLTALPKILEKAHEAIASKTNIDNERARQLAEKAKGKSASVGSGGTQAKATGTEPVKKFTKAQIQVMQEMGLYDNEQPID